ncbi:class I adenylate-forming enzyme family protein [Acrocarpospora catenulata]|uniref:class I adenylate-forming enzyme family protein n=1 Tax=Acrocarpospora catenulata TaxID=2836182 RepID=UPI001BDA7177|nr:AMP-binding protein [Acrocarpospora catenulata]
MRTTLGEEFDHALRRHADRTAIEYGERRLSFAELDRWSLAVAGQLRELGVGTGDVVAVHTRNCPQFVVVDVAIARLGAVKLPVNHMLPQATVAHILARTQAKVLVFGVGLAEIALGAAAESGVDPAPVQVADGPGPAVPEVAHLADLPDDVPDLPRLSLPAPADRAAIYFTGGTTGLPKGVVHTQSSAVALHYAQLLEAEILHDERLLLMTPLAHAAGLFAQSALLRGATIVIRDGFDAEQTVELLHRDRITWTFLVPTMIYRLLDVLARRPEVALRLRTVVYGAAPISPTRLAEALRVLGPVFIQLYGQTEVPNWGTRLPKSDHDPARPQLLGSCGQASIMTDVQVVDDEGTPVPPGQTGEICLRSPYALDCYLGDPEATRAKFLGPWVRTGDIGYLDDAGYLYLQDRKNDMVISGGMNVYCREVEDVLVQHPAISRVAVIGIPHHDWGEAVHAVVVPVSGEFAVEEVLAWVRGQLAGYARPKSIEVREVLPETPFGKIDKVALRRPYWAGRQRNIG